MQARAFHERIVPDAAHSEPRRSTLFQPSGAFSTAPLAADSRSARLTLDAIPPSKASAILDSGEETQQIWLREIRQCILRGKAQTMDLCRIVFGARRSLRHGQWTGLWRLEEAPFSKSKADKLARIGTWLKTLNAHTCEHLPAGWRILRVLSRLDARTTCSLVASGEIHVHLTLEAAQQVVATILKDQPRTRCEARISARVRNFCDFVRGTLPDWTAEEREQAANEISEVLDLISLGTLKHPRTLSKSSTCSIKALAPSSPRT